MTSWGCAVQEAKSGADAFRAVLEGMRERELQQSRHVSAELRQEIGAQLVFLCISQSSS